MDRPGKRLISIVIPAYNAAPFIESTVRSAMGQTYRELEILVVNDGSTDKTGQIVDKLALEDARIRQILIPNGGVARARNVGIEESRGELLAFLDADDLWHPSKIALQAEALAGPGGQEYGACYAFHRTIDGDDRIVSLPRGVACSGYILARHLFKKFVGNGSSIMVRRWLAIEVAGYDHRYAELGLGGCEDLDFELKLAAREKIVAVPQYLVGYRRYEGNMSSNRPRMARALVATIKNHIAANPQLPSKARRYSLAAAYEWASRQSWRSHDYYSAARYFSMVPLFDPVRGILVLLTGVARYTLGIVQSGEEALDAPPLFGDLSPTQPGSQTKSFERHRLSQLESIDLALYARLARN